MSVHRAMLLRRFGLWMGPVIALVGCPKPPFPTDDLGPVVVIPPVVDPPPDPISVPSEECNADTAGRPCSVKDRGKAPLPCQKPDFGRCDMGGQALCFFEWKDDGLPCNSGIGICENRQCRCPPNKCGYDCTVNC